MARESALEIKRTMCSDIQIASRRMANRPPPPLSGLQNHQHRDTNSKAEELRNGPHSLATSATSIAAHSPPNASFKSKCNASDPALLVPELCNEFPLPSASAAIITTPARLVVATIGLARVRFPTSSASEQSSSADLLPGTNDTAGDEICVQISIHPELPNVVVLRVSPPLPPPAKRLPWIKADQAPLPPPTPYIVIDVTDADKIFHAPLSNSVEIIFTSPLPSSPLPPPAPSSLPSSITLQFSSSEHCKRVCKALCHSLMIR
jgi:hypothetical protein